MISQTERIERFSALIDKTADKQVKKHEAAAKELFEKEVAAIEAELQAKLSSRLKFETDRINAASNRELSALENEARLRISEKRKEIENGVFADVEKKVREFVASGEYEDFLLASLKRLRAALGECRVFCAPADVERVKRISEGMEGIIEIVSSESISFGGLIGENADGTVFALDTLDSRLQKSREDFLSIVDLSV